MYPTPGRPALGSFVRDQVRALERIPGLELELFIFAPGAAGHYARAASELRRRYRGARFDVVHAHYGLSAWPALAPRVRARVVTLHGTDLSHPRTRLLTRAVLGRYDLVATVSEPLRARLPERARRRRTAVLPCGVDTERFAPGPRAAAREQLGLPVDEPCLLFPADPARAEKRFDRARAVAGSTTLHALGHVAPELVPAWVNAANAVLVPSEREGFGLAVLEALACDVPVLATPVGIHPEALAGVPGTLCAEFDAAAWRAALEPHLASADPRLRSGRERAARWSTDAMAARVVEAWRQVLGERG